MTNKFKVGQVVKMNSHGRTVYCIISEIRQGNQIWGKWVEDIKAVRTVIRSNTWSSYKECELVKKPLPDCFKKVIQ